MKRYVYLLMAGMLSILLTGCQSRTQADGMQRYSVSFFEYFDTVSEFTGYAESQEEFEQQIEPLRELLEQYHQYFDIYHSYEGISNLYTLNERAGAEPVEVSEEIFDLLEYAKEMYQLTNGQINIAMGSVLSIWHTYREAGLEDPEEAALPSMEELSEAAEHMDIENVLLDEELGTVYFADPELLLDVGALAKGYAAQKLADDARELGMDHLLINLGGNVLSVGAKPDGSSWVLGIQNPDLTSDESYITTIKIADECGVTSGDYQRFYTVEGENYCHIIDPDTLMPAAYFSSVTVICSDSALADALSTALFCMPLEEGQELIHSLSEVKALWVEKDGKQIYSEGF